MNKFLIVGLGNIGDEYKFTRHNIGFEVADTLVKSFIKEEDKTKTNLFENEKLAFVNHSRYKGKQLVIIKPHYLYESQWKIRKLLDAVRKNSTRKYYHHHR